MMILKIYLGLGFIFGAMDATYKIFAGTNTPAKELLRVYLLLQFGWLLVIPLSFARGFVVTIVRQELRAAFQAQSKFKRKS